MHAFTAVFSMHLGKHVEALVVCLMHTPDKCIVTAALLIKIERAVDWDAWERRAVIGRDEIALKRGHRDFVVLVTMPLEGRGIESLAVLADRKKETVAAFGRDT
jgi:hypothetical protein